MERNPSLIVCSGGGLVGKLCLTFATPCNYSLSCSSSVVSPKQEYWIGLPFPPPGDLPDPGMEPTSPALHADSLLLNH